MTNATLHARLDAATAQQQLEAIFNGIIECTRQQRGEGPEWAGFDREQLPDIIRALAIRGRDLAEETSTVLLSDPDLSLVDFEKVMSHG